MNPYISASKNLPYFSLFSPCFAPECPVLRGISRIFLFVLKLQIVANQNRIEQVITTC